MTASSGVEARLSGRRGVLALDVALSTRAQGVAALVGPSGSGKSTILRALAGLERLTGEVRVGDDVWQDAARFTPPHRRAVGYVAQGGALLPHLSGRRNLDYGRRPAGGGADELDRAIELLGLAPLLDRRPSRLSGGERQRVAIGRALVLTPKLLLLDEPLSGLDVEAKTDLIPALRRVFHSLAAAVIYVSHDRDEVARLTDQLIYLENGRIVEAPDGGARAPDLAGLTREEVERLALAAIRAGLQPR